MGVDVLEDGYRGIMGCRGVAGTNYVQNIPLDVDVWMLWAHGMLWSSGS